MDMFMAIETILESSRLVVICWNDSVRYEVGRMHRINDSRGLRMKKENGR